MERSFHAEPASDKDVHEVVRLIAQGFAHIPIVPLLGYHDTKESIETWTAYHLRCSREHLAETGLPCIIKCVHTDPIDGRETIVACAHWFIYPKARSENAPLVYIQRGDHLPLERRQHYRHAISETLSARHKWLDGRAHALFMYMATNEAWRRKGAATACVQWGLDRCRELGIPAYLEASEEGQLVYKKLGFEVVDRPVTELNGKRTVDPAMMWWPPGTPVDAKRPARG